MNRLPFLALLFITFPVLGDNSNVSSLLADMEQRLSYCEQTMAEMRGKLEETERKLQDLKKDSAQKSVALPGALPATSNTLVPLGQTIPESGTLPGTLPDTNVQKLYNQARSYLNKQAYREAEISFKDMIALYPKDPLVVNAKYWLGEIYLSRADYDKAALHFAEAYGIYQQQGGAKGNPDQQKQSNSKAPEALLKLAFALRGQNKKEEICATLEQLKSEFPSFYAAKKVLVEKASAGLKCS